MGENYSIQAENLMKMILKDFETDIKKYKIENITYSRIKSIKINIKNKTRRLTDICDIKLSDKIFKILVYNIEYIDLISQELDNIKLNHSINGQFLVIDTVYYSYNQIMNVIDEIYKFSTTTITKCSKAKLEPILRAKNGLENQFIDAITARETSKKSQNIYEKYNRIIYEKTLEKIKKILGDKNYKRFEKENIIYKSNL